jgi:hypothetical protein
MSGYNPNRVSAGKSDGGQFAAKVNGEQELDFEFEDYDADSSGTVSETYTYDEDLDEDDSHDWRDEVNFDSIAAADTPAKLNAINEKLSANLPLRKSPVSDHIGELDSNLQESAALIRAVDYRAIRMINAGKSDEGFSKEYVDGLRARAKVGAVRDNRDKLRKITSPAYDKIDELNAKVESKPNSAYAAKWSREAEAQRYTAITARAEIMNINERERDEA